MKEIYTSLGQQRGAAYIKAITTTSIKEAVLLRARIVAQHATYRDGVASTYTEYIDKINLPEGRQRTRRTYGKRQCVPVEWPRTELPLTHLSCTLCNVLQPVDNFGKQANYWGYFYYCKDCCRVEEDRTNRNSKRFTQRMFKHMVEHSQMRKQEPPEWRTYSHFVIWWSEQITRQEGRCAISGHLLAFERSSPFCVTPERPDNHNTYTSENCEAICLAFQSGDASKGKTNGKLSHQVTGTAQWSRAKFQLVPSLRLQEETSDEAKWLDDQIQKCEQIIHLSRGQKVWLTRQGQVGSCELSKFIVAKMNDRIAIAKRKYKRKGVEMEITIDAHWLLQEIKRTRLRCAYSNIRMAIKPRSEWLCSLERKDNSQGYTPTNTILVCHEFNNGLVQWSQELVNNFWGSM